MWLSKKATLNQGGFKVMCKGDLVQFPITAQIVSGDKFTIDSKSYRVIEAQQLRDENILTKVEETKDDKPTSRRTRNKPSGTELPDPPESGLDSSD